VAISSFDPDLSLEVLDHPVLDFFYYMVSTMKCILIHLFSSAVFLFDAVFPFVVDRDTALCPCTIRLAETSSQACIRAIQLYSLEDFGMLC
jgi:hypothetical protein